MLESKNCDTLEIKIVIALVAELVDALDSKSSSFESAGSIPASSTIKPHNLMIMRLFCFNE